MLMWHLQLQRTHGWPSASCSKHGEQQLGPVWGIWELSAANCGGLERGLDSIQWTVLPSQLVVGSITSSSTYIWQLAVGC